MKIPKLSPPTYLHECFSERFSLGHFLVVFGQVPFRSVGRSHDLCVTLLNPLEATWLSDVKV